MILSLRLSCNKQKKNLGCVKTNEQLLKLPYTFVNYSNSDFQEKDITRQYRPISPDIFHKSMTERNKDCIIIIFLSLLNMHILLELMIFKFLSNLLHISYKILDDFIQNDLLGNN